MKTDKEVHGIWNYSQTRKAVQRILAIKGVIPRFVRIWHDNGKNVRIGVEASGRKYILGGGDSFQDAFEKTFVAPLEARMKAKMEAELEGQDKNPRDSEAGEGT